MSEDYTLHLVVLVPGKDERETLEGLLTSRRQSLGIRPLQYRLLVHPRRDPGCFIEGPDVLQPFQKRTERAVVMFDHEGSGQESKSPEEVVSDLKHRLSVSGWGDRTEVLLMQPELENWVWSDSPEVDAALGWERRRPALRPWLAEQGFWPEDQTKPPRPKEAMEAALREARRQRSSAIYRQLAEKVGLRRCEDRTFLQFRDLVQRWFPTE